VSDLTEDVQRLLEWKAAKEMEITELKAGVTNFRAFKDRASKFFDWFEGKTEAEEKARETAAKLEAAAAEKRNQDQAREDQAQADRHKTSRQNRIAIASILAVLVLPPAGWFCEQTSEFIGKVTKIVQEWDEVHEIIREWHAAHQSEFQKKGFNSAPPIHAKDEPPDLPSDAEAGHPHW
jgi:hypothetical protein